MKKTLASLQRQVETMHSQMMSLVKANRALEKELAKLKAQGPPMTEAAKQQLIKEYKISPELIEDVMQQFGDGYQSAKEKDKAKMLAASLDPSILDSLDEEPEAKDNPPTN